MCSIPWPNGFGTDGPWRRGIVSLQRLERGVCSQMDMAFWYRVETSIPSASRRKACIG